MKITKQNLKKIIIESIDSSINLKHAASFIYRSNEIEDYIEDIEDVMSALEGVIEKHKLKEYRQQ